MLDNSLYRDKGTTDDYVLLTVQQAHELTDLPKKTLYRACSQGLVRTCRVGRSLFILRASLLETG